MSTNGTHVNMDANKNTGTTSRKAHYERQRLPIEVSKSIFECVDAGYSNNEIRDYTLRQNLSDNILMAFRALVKTDYRQRILKGELSATTAYMYLLKRKTPLGVQSQVKRVPVTEGMVEATNDEIDKMLKFCALYVANSRSITPEVFRQIAKLIGFKLVKV